MLWIIYNILFPIGFLLLLPKFLFRMCRRGGYLAGFMQRFALYPDEIRRKMESGEIIWIQAVSVGEIFVALRFIEKMRAAWPEKRFVLSTNTSTGYRIGKREIDERDVLVYFPLDFPFIMRRVLRMMRPELIILIENEMWPNMIRYADRKGIPVVLVNGRISAHSFKGYSKLRVFTKELLPLVKLFCAQSQEDAERLISLGAPANQVKIMGSAKYDVIQRDAAGEAVAAEVLKKAGYADRDILLGGSTWPGEEKVLLELYKRVREKHPQCGLLLAPRHVERLEEVLREIREQGLTCQLRSEVDQTVDKNADVFVLNTTGELKNFYRHAAVIFVGKSLTQHGGQNPIEPAFYGKPVLVGPNMENFPGVMEDFLAADGLIQVTSAEALEQEIERLLADDATRAAQGRKAAQLVKEKSGVIEATVREIEQRGLVS
jgi:3-deoxy-D-manno-octulosonic-acid transferase